ncbi:hypothetical protein [Lentzea sp. E54]|uniref:hypothetical protein n=1 Tax=Lentzea xerophila TaxID=3435883 RepID=UPI003DA5B999
MAVTLAQQVERVRDALNQSNSEELCTFKGWLPEVGSPKTGIKLDDVMAGDRLSHVLVELGHELVYVTSYDSQTLTATCPPWFRQRNGSPANDDYPADSVAVIGPQWSHWTIVQQLVAGYHALHPDLFQVKTTTLTTTAVEQRYELPADCDDIHDIQLHYPDASGTQRAVNTWSIKTTNPDGKRYLHISPVGMGGLTLDVTYKAKPIVPDPADGSFQFTESGLLDSAEDLPVMYAKAHLVASMESSRAQTKSIEQSERGKYIQAGTTTSVARLWMQQFQDRLKEERRKLLELYPPRVHRELNG